jgi:hypothetical protein
VCPRDGTAGSFAIASMKRGERILRRLLLCMTVVVFAFGVTAATATASSPHFKKGGSPVCTISGTGTNSTSTVCKASLSGLGMGTLVINVTVSGSALYQCQNNGGSTAPGQNKVLVGPVTAPTTIPADQIKNGNVSFTTNAAVLTAPDTVSGAAAGCPNPNWTGVNPTLTTTDISMTISQGGVLLFTCTASNPNGLSGTVPLSC